MHIMDNSEEDAFSPTAFGTKILLKSLLSKSVIYWVVSHG